MYQVSFNIRAYSTLDNIALRIKGVEMGGKLIRPRVFEWREDFKFEDEKQGAAFFSIVMNTPTKEEESQYETE
jgi:hypothetical protein